MKTFAFLTERQHEVLEKIITGQALGRRTVALIRVLNNLYRIGMIDDHFTVTPATLHRWKAWQHLQELGAMDE